MELNVVKDVIKEAIKRGINTRVAPLNLIGHAGIGKTQILRDIAAELNIPIHIFRLGSMQDVGDMMGAPYVTEGGETKYGTPDWFLDLQNGGILFIDEVNRAKPTLTDAVMQLLDMGRFNKYILPDNCYIIAAMNPSDENYDTNDFDQAIIDRCVNIAVTQSSEEVIKYTMQNEFNPEVIDLITLAKDDIFVGKGVDIPKKKFTPRNIRQLNAWIEIILSNEKASDELVMGCIGPTGFSKWKNREILKKIPSAESYFKNPDGYNVDELTAIEKTVLLTRVVQWLKNKKANDELKQIFSKLVIKLGEQMLAFTFRLSINDMKHLNKFLDHTDPEFQKKCKEISDVIRGY